MKTRQTSDTASRTAATHNTNSSAPSQAAVTSSSPTVKNRQTVDQKRARYGQARNLPAYQRDTNIKKVKIEKQGGTAGIQQAPKQDNRWAPSAQAIDPNHHRIVRTSWGSDTSEIDMSNRKMSDADVLALANFLRGNTAITKLKLDYCSISTAGARALAEALKVNTTLNTLELGYNEFGAEGAVALSEALLVNTTLTSLHLNGNNIGAEGAVALAEVLLGNTTLTTLNLYFNQIGAEGAVVLSEALLGNTSLRTLDLSRNDIGAEGAAATADVLKGSTAITELDLSGNDIGDEGAKALADALKVNTTLTELNIGCDFMGDEGAKALADALKINKTLTMLNLFAYEITEEGEKAMVEALRVNETLTSFRFSPTLIGQFDTETSNLLERNKRLKLQPYAEASLDLLVRHSPALKNMGLPTDLMPVLAEQLSTEVLAVFEQEWRDALRAPPPPITTTTTNATVTTTTTTTTDSTIPTLITSPAATATSPASVPPVITQPTATAAEINALLADPNPVAAISRWIDGHANPAAALNWVDPSNGYTLLHYAVAAQQGGVVRILLARNIDRARADKNNQTAAQLAQQRADSSSSSTVAAIAALFK